MKTIILTISSILLLSCNSEVKDNNTIVENQDTILASPAIDLVALDSIMVENKFVNTPFHKEDEIIYFKKIAANRTKINVELKKNIHDETIIDTVKTIYWGKSYIETLTNNSSDRVFLLYAVINDNNIVLRNNIRIGQELKAVCTTFNIKYDTQKKYKYIELATPVDANSYLTFYFKDNILVSIEYSPYTG